MGPIGFGAETPASVLFVFAVVAGEPDHLAVALKGQNVGGDPVQEPAIMGDDQRRTGKGIQRVFQRAQRVDIQIVAGLIQQQHIGPGLEQFGEMDAVALTAGKIADLLLLIGAGEVEARHIGA